MPRTSPRLQSYGRSLETALGLSSRSLRPHSCLSIGHPSTYRLSLRVSSRHAQGSLRHASTLTSSTAVNATKEIPARARGLYDSLKMVEHSAASYVSLSRLQLALRGLETENPVVRVAILGIEDKRQAVQLAKVLLADPLSTELPWESYLEEPGDDGRCMLLRYGESAGIGTENPLLKTLLIPSLVLKNNHLEILIASIRTQSSMPIDGSPTVNPAHMVLVPRLEFQASAGNQFTAINYPAHKSILYGNGIRSCLELGRLTAGWPDNRTARKMMKVVFGLRAPVNAPTETVEDRVTAVDVELASSAIRSFRESLRNATKFEQEWFRSGMPALVDFLVRDLGNADQTITPAVRHLIQSLLDDAEEAVTRKEMESIRAMTGSAVPEDKRKRMKDSLDVWAERAHTELRDQLDIAFNGKQWRRLKWWKLFWRVDDMGMIAAEILQRRWLVQAEKDIIWMAGRIEGVGFFKSLTDMARAMDTRRVVKGQSKNPENPESMSAPPNLIGSTEMTAADDVYTSPPPLGPWPLNISLARSKLSTKAIISLESLGQLLLLETLNTSIFSSTISAMLYFLWDGASTYQVGAIAAFGIAWSMRRLQHRWETARQVWEGEVRETGRRALKETQDTVATIIDNEGRAEERIEDVEERRTAKALIDTARQALNKLR